MRKNEAEGQIFFSIVDRVFFYDEQPSAEPGVAGKIYISDGGRISGTVCDEKGKPFAKADVWADYWDGGGADGTKTDESGNYVIKGLTGGAVKGTGTLTPA